MSEFLVGCKKMVEDLFEILEVELDELTELEKELIIVYSFGMASVMAEENQIELKVQYMCMEKVIEEVFLYSKQETFVIVDEISKSINGSGDEKFRIMLYQGGKIYAKYRENNYNEVYDRLTNLIDIIANGEYEV